MKEKKRRKAIQQHRDMLRDYANTIHEIIDDMYSEGANTIEVAGMLELEKQFRFRVDMDKAHVGAVLEMLEDEFEEE